MPSINLPVRNFKGIIPSLDRRQIEDAFVLDGKNFLVDLKGPNSAFGIYFPFYEQIDKQNSAFSFRIEDYVIICTSDAFYRFDVNSERFYPVFTFTNLTTIWPWTLAKVGGNYYFAHKDYTSGGNAAIIEFNPVTNAWNNITTSIPVGALAVTQSRGRVVVLGTSQYAWSALDNGSDFVSSLTTGAGAQNISTYAQGNSIYISETPDGFIVFTDHGLIKSEFADLRGTPFRHFRLSHKGRVLGPFCITTLKNHETVFLDRDGSAYTTRGEIPEKWQPLFFEFIRRQSIIKNFDISTPALCKFYYDEIREWFFLSLATTERSEEYDIAYILYIPKDEWGIFNKRHAAFLEIHFDTGILKGSRFGYLGEKGYFHYFNDFPRFEALPEVSGTNYYFHPHFNYPARLQDGVYHFPSVMEMHTVNQGLFPHGMAGLFTFKWTLYGPEPDIGVTLVQLTANSSTVEVEDWNSLSGTEDWNILTGSEDYLSAPDEGRFPSYMGFGDAILVLSAQLNVRTYIGLDAEVTIGLFRYLEGEHGDELSLLTDLVIGMEESPGENEFLDYNLIAEVTEDWNVLTGSEDWGEGIFIDRDYNLTLTGSLDGINKWEDQEEIPEEILDSESVKYFAGSTNGVYHFLKIRADTDQQSFHLNLLEVDGTVIGRL